MTSIGMAVRKPGNLTLLAQALAILRRFGTNAHAYIPGIGTISGLTAGNYLLSDGSTGLTPVDGLQGLMLDGMGSVGADMFSPYTRNNTVEAGTTGFPAVCTATGVFSVVGVSINTVTANAPYRVNLTWSGNTAGRQISVGGGSAFVAVSTAVSGSAEITVAPSIANMYVYFNASAGGQAVSFDSVTCKPVSGIHATSSGAARPTLRRGLVNLLTYSQDLTNAAWGKAGSSLPVITAGATDPFGGTSAYEFDLTPAGDCRVSNNPTGVSNNSGVTEGVWLKAKTTGGTVSIGVRDGAGAITYSTVTITTEWVLYAASFTGAAGSFTALTYVGNRLNGGTCNNFYVYRAGLFQGTLTASQILAEGGIPLTTSAAASNPLAGRYSSQYSGAQSLTLGSVPTPNSGDFSVIVGVNATNATGNPRIYAARGATASIRLYMDNATGAIYSAWTDDAANTQQSGAPASDVGVTRIASIRRTGNAKELRVNGASRLVNSTAQGAYTLTAAEIGMQNAGTYLTGSLGPLVHVTGTITDADLLVLERFVASLTPNGPSF